MVKTDTTPDAASRGDAVGTGSHRDDETKRQANMRRRRERIVDAARALIFEDGLPAMSMRRVAERADVSPMTLYNLFGGKDEILVAVVGQAIDTMDARLAAEAPVDVDPIARCRAVITVSIEVLASQPELSKPMLLAGFERSSGEALAQARAGRRGARMQLEGLEVAMRQGLLRADVDVVALADQIYHGYELAALQWARDDITTDGFEARALYGLWIALLSAGADSIRRTLEQEMHKAASVLRSTVIA